MKGLAQSNRKSYSLSVADKTSSPSLTRTISMTSLLEFNNKGNLSTDHPSSSITSVTPPPPPPPKYITTSSRFSNTYRPIDKSLVNENTETVNFVKPHNLAAVPSPLPIQKHQSFNGTNKTSTALAQALFLDGYPSPTSPPGSDSSTNPKISSSLYSHESSSIPIYPHLNDINLKENDDQHNNHHQPQQFEESLSRLYHIRKSNTNEDIGIHDTENNEEVFGFDIFKLEESPNHKPSSSIASPSRNMNIPSPEMKSHISIYEQNMKENISQLNKKQTGNQPPKRFPTPENFPFLPTSLSLASACAVDISGGQEIKEFEKNHKNKKNRGNKAKNGNHDHIFYELSITERKKNHKCFKDVRLNNIFANPKLTEETSAPSGSIQTNRNDAVPSGNNFDDSHYSSMETDDYSGSSSSGHRISTSFGPINQLNCMEMKSPISKETYDEQMVPASPLRQTPSMVMLDAAAASFEQNREDTFQRFENIHSSNPVYKVIAPSLEENISLGSSSLSTSPTDKSTLSGPLAVFKETSNNEIERNGLLAREVILRERAAYLLDKNSKGFSNVPPTALAKISKQKKGALQQYVENIGNCEDNPDMLSKVDPEQVHKVAILDIRIFNTDRHGGNILITKHDKLQKQIQLLNRMSNNSHSEGSCDDMAIIAREENNGFEEDCIHHASSKNDELVLVPIDHSLSLPSIHFLSDAYFDWAYYDSASTPFSEKTIEHILKNIDVAQDQRSLRELGLREECIATNVACTILLQTAVSLKPPFALLSDFATILQRPYPPGHNLFDQYWSPFEYMIDEAFREAGESYELRKIIASQNPKRDNPPPAKFYEALERVIRRNLQSGDWRQHLPP